MTSETRRAWRLAIFQQRNGLWSGYAGQGEVRLSSRGPTAAAAMEALRAIVDEYDAIMAGEVEVTHAN